MAEAQAASFFKEKFSLKAFIQGLAAAALAYGLLLGLLIFNADKTLEHQQAKLASQTVIVDWPDSALPPKNQVTQPETAEQAPANPEQQQAAPSPAQTTQSAPEGGLATAPIEGLFETTPDGHLPVVRAADGLTPFKAYRRPFDLQAVGGKPIIAVAIDGMGLSDLATESAVRAMPGEISFIFSPYAPAPDFWVREARARGHEVWLTLPVEPKDYPLFDPGPHTMLISAPERENQEKLNWVMSRTDGYVGFVTPPEPVFMKALNDMRPVVGNIYHRGLALIDGSADPGQSPQSMAVGMKAPYGTVDLWIDRGTASQEGLKAALARLEETAKTKGFAVGVIHTLPVSYQEILDWAKTLPGKGIVLAPLSATAGY